MALIIHGSVGRNGQNNPADVRVVQRLLNDYTDDAAKLLKVDGLVGPKTLAAITNFQTNVTKKVDGRIDPNGPAIRKLAEFHFKKVLEGVSGQASCVLGQQCASLADVSMHLLVAEYWQLLRKA